MRASVDQIRLLSRVRGRERWCVQKLKGRPRLAVAVELALRRASPGLIVHANPLTGSVLLRWEREERIGSSRVSGDPSLVHLTVEIREPG